MTTLSIRKVTPIAIAVGAVALFAALPANARPEFSQRLDSLVGTSRDSGVAFPSDRQVVLPEGTMVATTDPASVWEGPAHRDNLPNISVRLNDIRSTSRDSGIGLH